MLSFYVALGSPFLLEHWAWFLWSGRQKFEIVFLLRALFSTSLNTMNVEECSRIVDEQTNGMESN